MPTIPAYEAYISLFNFILLITNLLLSFYSYFLDSSYLTNATLFLSWSHRYKMYAVVSTNWLAVVQFSNWLWIFSLSRIGLFAISPTKLLPGLTIWVTPWVSFKSLLTRLEYMSNTVGVLQEPTYQAWIYE